MYRLVLIDDEALALDHLVNCLDYPSLGIEICGTATNGNQGLELICLNNPDIVVTDIKMPGLNGIDLLKALSQFDAPPEVIFVSGYSDFDYAKQAIRYGACDYILKPITSEELLEALQQAMGKVQKKQQREQERSELYQSFQQIQTSYEFQALKNYLTRRSPSPPEISHLFSLAPTVYLIVTITATDGEEICQSEVFRQITQFVLSSHTLMLENGSSFSILLGGISKPELEKEAERLASQILQLLEKQEEIDAIIGVSNSCEALSDLPDALSQSYQALIQKLFAPGESLFHYEHIQIKEEQVFSKVFSTLLDYLRIADKASVSHYLKTIFNHLRILKADAIVKNQTEFWVRMILEIEHALSSQSHHIVSSHLLNEWFRAIS